MAKVKIKKNSAILAEFVVQGLLEKKGKKIVCLDLTKLDGAVCDYFIICHADSTTQVGALAESVEDTVRIEMGEKKWNSEGQTNSTWILLDYSNVVVHVFQRETREFYNLEELWADAKIQEIESE
ncbi:MAG: ribosome silencing factor [Flavobacteriales bacterium]|nr:ribosome silencing factor [Flavobacteriales bacterium]